MVEVESWFRSTLFEISIAWTSRLGLKTMTVSGLAATLPSSQQVF